MIDSSLDAETVIHCHVHPKSSRLKHQFTGLEGEVWLPAPPEGGRANRLLIDYLAKLLGISSSRITIVQGVKARDKRLLIKGLGASQVVSILSETPK